ncbi:hypothetical protein HWV62_33687 [Athelia sp. TMB]|nr:hypothetical protein HWV62_33687 [Athelia sp. TMB]
MAPAALALSIPDILWLILDHLPAAEASSACALARLARTSRAWHTPALAILWRILPSPSPLRALMPPVDEAACPKTWRSFDAHARLVLFWGHDTRFLAHVYRHRPAPPFLPPVPLPALQVAGLQSDDPIAIHEAPPRLPSLHTAHVYFSRWSRPSTTPGLCDPLRFLVAAASSLTTLSLSGRVPHADTQILLELKCLRRLDLARAELPPGALSLLAQMPLRSLVLPGLESGDAEGAVQGFASLEHVRLPSCSPASATAFFAALSAPETLRCVSIHAALSVSANSFSAQNEWEAVFPHIPRTLRVLALRLGGTAVPLAALSRFEELHTLDADVSLGASAARGRGCLVTKRAHLCIVGLGAGEEGAESAEAEKLTREVDALWPVLEALVVSAGSVVPLLAGGDGDSWSWEAGEFPHGEECDGKGAGGGQWVGVWAALLIEEDASDTKNNRSLLADMRKYPTLELFLWFMGRLIASLLAVRARFEADFREREREARALPGDALTLCFCILACDDVGASDSVDVQRLMAIQDSVTGSGKTAESQMDLSIWVDGDLVFNDGLDLDNALLQDGENVPQAKGADG